jgi:hypothetical protein
MSISRRHPSHEQAHEREHLSGAFGADPPQGERRVLRGSANQLLPHYVYGILREFETGRCHLDAPLDDLVFQEPFTFDAATDVFSLYGPDLSKVPMEARVEAGTPEALRNEDGTRHATWVNVNMIYSHGDVISIDDESTVTLQQAHGGSVRTLLVDAESTVNSRTGNLEAIAPGDHLFFTGMAETAELSCPRIHIVVLNH